MFLIILVNIAILGYLESIFPNWITYYATEQQELLDKLIGAGLSLLLVNYVTIHGQESYNSEKLKARESDRMKSAFLANLSHEIRTPLNSVIGFSELIAESPNLSTEEHKTYQTLLHRNNHQLLSTIENLIQLSELQKEKPEYSFKNYRLNEELKEIADQYIKKIQYEFNKERIIVRLVLPKSDNTLVRIQYTAVKQILYKLIDNAIKFTTEGSIELGYFISNESQLTFFIKDEGPRIPLEEHAHIFKQFYKYEKKDEDFHPGTGTGLAIAQRIIDIIDGQIWVNSTPNFGTTFYFTVPCLKLK